MANPTPVKVTKKMFWKEAEIELLKKIYPNTSNDNVAKQLKKTVRAIRAKAMVLRLKKDDRYWQLAHEKFLLKQWEVLTPIEIAEAMKKKFGVEKTKWSIINKYRELKGFRAKNKAPEN